MLEITPELVVEHRRRLLTALDECRGDMTRMSFTQGDPQHLVIAGLYATIIQSVSECTTLMQQPTIMLPGMLRSLLEATADYYAVIESDDYRQRMLATFEYQKQLYYEGMIKNKANPMHQDMAMQLDPAVELAATNATLKEYEDAGFYPLRIWERFKAAGLSDIYQSFYWNLCLEGHNNVAIIQQRHIEVHGKDIAVIPLKENSLEEMIIYMQLLTAILLEGTGKIHRFLGTTLSSYYERRFAEYNEFRQFKTS